MKKFNSLKKFQYPSLWNDDPCNEKNQVDSIKSNKIDCFM